MKIIYINLDLDIEKIIFKYKGQIICMINKRKEICPAKNISHH